MVKKISSTSAILSQQAKEAFGGDKAEKAAPIAGTITFEWLKNNAKPRTRYTIPLDLFDFDNTRTQTRPIDPQAVANLVEDITRNGQINQVFARMDETTQKLQIGFGWHRSFALKELDKPIETELFFGTEQELYLLALSENITRKQLSKYDELVAMAALEKQDISKENIASIFHLSSATIYQTLRISSFPVLMNGLKDEKISVRDARILAVKASSNSLGDDFQKKAVEVLAQGRLRSSDLEVFLESGANFENLAALTSAAQAGNKHHGAGKKGKKIETANGPKLFLQKVTNDKYIFKAVAKRGDGDLEKIKKDALQFVNVIQKMIEDEKKKKGTKGK